MGDFLQQFIAFCVLFHCAFAAALDARVLIDEKSTSKIITGDLQIDCVENFAKACHRQSLNLATGSWRLERYYNKLRLTNLKTQDRYLMRGSKFHISGSFQWDNKTLKKMDLVFANRLTQWVVHIPVDQYLYGVMSAEVPASWPLEALKAQAVASRTYFLFKKAERIKENFDVRSDIMDQVFKLDANKQAPILRAVDETHGEILISQQNGKIFPAYFHSDCGGRTSSEKLVWRKPSSLNQAVQDPYCQTASKNNWSYDISKDRLLSLLQSSFYLPKGVELISILPRLQKKSRAYIVDFIFSKNIFKRMSADDLRHLLGFGKLRSAHFSVTQTWDDVVFTGRGFGHGVGLCQWGAQRWARKGKDYRTILSHYYPKAKRKVLDSRSLQAQLVF